MLKAEVFGVRVWELGFRVTMSVQTPMAQGRSTEIISMIKWIRTRRLSIKNSLSDHVLRDQGRRDAREQRQRPEQPEQVRAPCAPPLLLALVIPDYGLVWGLGFRVEGLGLGSRG